MSQVKVIIKVFEKRDKNIQISCLAYFSVAQFILISTVSSIILNKLFGHIVHT